MVVSIHAACQEVQNPVPQGGAETRVSELGDELGGQWY